MSLHLTSSINIALFVFVCIIAHSLMWGLTWAVLLHFFPSHPTDTLQEWRGVTSFVWVVTLPLALMFNISRKVMRAATREKLPKAVDVSNKKGKIHG